MKGLLDGISQFFLYIWNCVTWICDSCYRLITADAQRSVTGNSNKMGNIFSSRKPLTPYEAEKKRVQEARDRYIDERFSTEEDEVDGHLTAGKGLMNHRSKLTKMPSILNDLEVTAMKIDPRDRQYPFENLVFEGGGNKGLAYCGAVKVLEEVGIINNIRRFAGASAGAMTAALLAVGYDSGEIKDFLSQDLSQMFLDARFGVLSLLPNLLSGYGWNPGMRIYQWFGDALAKKMGNPDISFEELYQQTGRELCVVVTNLNHMCEEYCHPKTTPDMPIRLAVRMSMSIPGMFQATNYTVNGETNTYVDGGVICNYPIHCYDGWWLSMKADDSFLERLQPLDDLPQLLDRRNRFRKDTFIPEKTLGFLLYADSEQDVFRFLLEKRIGCHMEELPDTKLSRVKQEQKRVQEKAKREHRRVAMAVDQFLKVLKKHNLDRDNKISRVELENAFSDEEFSKASCELIFWKDCKVGDAFQVLDKDGNGEISFNELMHFIQGTGISLQQRFLGYQRKDINGLFSFFDTLQNALLTNVKRAFVNDDDLERTVGINTGHVGTSDFKLEELDRDYVIKQGYNATISYLRYFSAKNQGSRTTSETIPEKEDIKTNGDVVSDDDVLIEEMSDEDEEKPILQGANG